MKKYLAVLFTAVLAMSLFFVSPSYAAETNKNLVEQKVTVIINGEIISFNDPILNNSGTILLPMRDFYEAIGAEVSWNQIDKIATSERNGQIVELTINSKTAKVNGDNAQLLVAPMIYKDRTYIPMRFVSENSDGQVYWNQENKVVEIILNEDTNDGQSPGEEEPEEPAPIIPEEKYILYMNNQRVEMELPPITKDGRMYIPVNYFSDYLQDSFNQWVNETSLDLTISGITFNFTENSNKIYINGELYSGNEKPFIQYGEMYVPVKFIVDSFKNGGSLRYVQEDRTIYISLYDYIMTSDFLEKSYGSLNVPQLVENAALDGKRELFVSDNPEELTPTIIMSANETLAENHVQGVTSTKEHRVYGWHINKLGDRAKIGITIQNTSSSEIQVMNSKGVSQTTSNSWSTFDVGLPLSDAVLTNTLRDAKESKMTIAPGETKIIQSYDIGKNYLLGFTHDFDIRSVTGAEVNYTIRTVISLDSEPKLEAIQTPAVRINEYAAHPRGVWPSSALKVTLPSYTVDSEQVGYNISNGKTDHFLTAENSLDKMNGTVGNPGHFGMTYKVDIPVVNNTGKLKYVVVKITGRGGFYSGAVKMNGRTYLIPTLKPGQEYVQLPVHRSKKMNDVINLEIIHAGGSNLPVAIYVETR
ncbi:copper amine oxidase N-terminal domain-containing protein [Solibacillus sp. MA9]|uniref:Copper amine oxidase N-terminal domain-containing protein n=1 Tax=Solibacillus palustris TaxID=2908203 RepID=A0ABS9U9H4_9BACL|nr:stalk domain-containing protein [Solibacillus sp. MA9]MCH7320618.1 copper amine oxidase N-terminal domain-containing protein [Solibacillus sp. MA9]